MWEDVVQNLVSWRFSNSVADGKNWVDSSRALKAEDPRTFLTFFNTLFY